MKRRLKFPALTLGLVALLGTGLAGVARAEGLPGMGEDATPWRADVIYENDTHFRGADATGKTVGLSKFRNTLQVETDKAVVNVPAPISGVIKENFPENSDVHLGDTVAYIGTQSEIQLVPMQPSPPVLPQSQAASTAQPQAPAAPAAQPQKQPAPVQVVFPMAAAKQTQQQPAQAPRQPMPN